MAGTFSGLEIASRALQANQSVIDVIGHNISNVNTPDYTREVAQVQATDPYLSNVPGLPTISYGTGVHVSSVDRIRDAFVERRLNDAIANQGQYRQLDDTLTRVQAAYNEPGDAGLNNAMSTFFNSFQDVSRQPESTGPRTLVQHYADDLAQKFRTVYSTLSGSSLDITERVRAMVVQVNDLAHQIGTLNVEVSKSISVGGQSNDLQDRRDSLVREMSKLVGVTVVEESDGTGKKTGSVNLSVGGVPLVQGGTVVEVPDKFGTVRGQAVLLNGTDPLPVHSGELGGLIQSNNQVRSYMADLNKVAATLITAVNKQHAAG